MYCIYYKISYENYLSPFTQFNNWKREFSKDHWKFSNSWFYFRYSWFLSNLFFNKIDFLLSRKIKLWFSFLVFLCLVTLIFYNTILKTWSFMVMYNFVCKFLNDLKYTLLKKVYLLFLWLFFHLFSILDCKYFLWVYRLLVFFISRDKVSFSFSFSFNYILLNR